MTSACCEVLMGQFRTGVARRRLERGNEMKLRIDTERCRAHGQCYALAPELVQPDADGHALIADEDVAPGLEDKARLVVVYCPEQALEVIE